MQKFVLLGFLATALLVENTSGGMMDDIKKWGKETQEALTTKYKEFSGWSDAKLKEITDSVGDRKEALQKMAQEIIKDADSGALQEKVATQAKEFFSKYKEELGDQYDKVQASIKKRFPDADSASTAAPATK
jgi:gas vesicle protein